MKPLRWLEIILLITGLTTLTMCIPSESILSYLRSALVIIFVCFIPGNCLVNILFRKRNKLDLIEEVVLSVALSFGITGITGLFLGLSPIKLDVISIAVSLISITIVLALTAFMLKNKDIKNQNSNNSSSATKVADY
ncbi:MAG: DUF1616 domain-containing protein [Candidatus Bathyarchaeota archaeon]|nr:DUF1616 domain-containing protein [Candidatus Termiticorpusculum sp.]MCL2867826.1 DUF1616 domain-containing protein [Candidatus Termiticorpusculum sp.]